jgi:hypothetical protein
VALAVPIICAAVLLRLQYQISAFLPGLISLFLAVLCLLLCLASLLIRERPPWLAGVAFVANGLLLYSLTFINLH